MSYWRSNPRKRYNLTHLRVGEAQFYPGIEWEDQKRIEWAVRMCARRTGRAFRIDLSEREGDPGILVTYVGEQAKPINAEHAALMAKRPRGRPALYAWDALPIDREVSIPCESQKRAEALLRSLFAWLSTNRERVYSRVEHRGPTPSVVVMRSRLPREGIR